MITKIEGSNEANIGVVAGAVVAVLALITIAVIVCVVVFKR